jgi:hypothetical protein
MAALYHRAGQAVIRIPLLTHPEDLIRPRDSAMSTASPPKHVADFARQAVEYVQRAVGIEVEYDSETLPVVDHYLREVPRDQPEASTVAAIAAGAYFGEVVRRHIGGRWEAEGEPEGWRVVLPIGVSFCPAAVVLAAILREESADAEFYVPAVLTPYAEDTLARMGEVSEDVYYSLCGRLDTLEHLHEVLVAVAAERARKNEAAN